jgi:AcrR family transcriptional regulator
MEEDPEKKLSNRAEARRDKIFAAALEVISRKGFHETSIADIAGRASVSRATVYQYFCDKRDILASLTDRVAQRVIDAMDAWAPLPIAPTTVGAESSFATGEGLRQMIDTRISEILDAISENADAFRLMIRLKRGSEGVADDAPGRIDDHVVAILTRDIQAAAGFGWARSCDAQMIARFLLGGIQKLLEEAFDRPDPVHLDTQAIAGEIGALVFFGLAHGDMIASVVRSR